MEKVSEISFRSKAESNEHRLEEALVRTPHEQFLFFLKMIDEMQLFNTLKENPNRIKNNFVIE